MTRLAVQERPKGITPDGALLDSFRLIHGLWEAKDTDDDLDKEITATCTSTTRASRSIRCSALRTPSCRWTGA